MHLLDNYTFDAHTRYEAHRLIYAPVNDEPIEFGGILAASIFAALIVDTDEGDARGIALDTPERREAFFVRYEKEVRRDNGGLFNTEVQALCEAYMEINGDMAVLLSICGNDRLYDLAFGTMIEYMERLVKEQIQEHIYDVVLWTEPFAQWLYNAGFVETRRQQLLAIDWSDPAGVYALAEFLRKPEEPKEPTFVFDGLSAEQVLNGYWDWLWNTVQTDASLYPDAKVRLAEYKEKILKNEPDFDFLKPEMTEFKPEQINLFRKWMHLWTEFVKGKIEPSMGGPKQQQKKEEQLFFPDEVLKCPTEDDPEKYAATREYIKDRKGYDKDFRNFVKNSSHARLCRQLTMLFGWYVDPNSLRKSLLRKPKRKTKKYT